MKIILIKKLIALMTTLLAVLQGQSLTLGAITSYTEVSPTVIGVFVSASPINRFENNLTKEIIEEPTTREAYYQVADIKDFPQPFKVGYRWIGASVNETYAIEPRILKDNEYYIVGADVASSTLVNLKLPGEPEKVVLLNSL